MTVHRRIVIGYGPNGKHQVVVQFVRAADNHVVDEYVVYRNLGPRSADTHRERLAELLDRTYANGYWQGLDQGRKESHP